MTREVVDVNLFYKNQSVKSSKINKKSILANDKDINNFIGGALLKYKGGRK